MPSYVEGLINVRKWSVWLRGCQTLHPTWVNREPTLNTAPNLLDCSVHQRRDDAVEIHFTQIFLNTKSIHT